MLETLIPYSLIIWALSKLGLINLTKENLIKAGLIYLVILFSLFTVSRYISYFSLDDTTIVTTRYIALSSPAGTTITNVYVKHNQHVKKGDLILTFSTRLYDIQKRGLVAQLKEYKSILNEYKTDLASMEKLQGSVFSIYDIKTKKYDIATLFYKIKAVEAQIKQLQWKIDNAVVRAPVDGVIGIVFTAKGTYINEQSYTNILLYTDQKFIIVRIPDQVYSTILPGAFAEFYVDAYPGRIFRARVTEVMHYTGEAQNTGYPVIPITQWTREHTNRNSGNKGRLVVLTFKEPKGVEIPVGAVGGIWIAGKKPMALGFLDLLAGIFLRTDSIVTYLKAF